REALDTCRARSREMEGRVATAEQAAQLASTQQAQHQEQARQWEGERLEGASRLAAINAELAEERSERAALQAALDELRPRRDREPSGAIDADADAVTAADAYDELCRALDEPSPAHEASSGEDDQLQAQASEIGDLEPQGAEPLLGDADIADL